VIPADAEEAGFTAEGGHGAVPTRGVETGSGEPQRRSWPLYEVFVRGKRGLNHVHVGSLHAADAEMALHNARDLYTRRNEGVSIWVVRAEDITASIPGEKDPFFAPAGDKIYRHPTFYAIPEEVPHL
jgi:ring-1,2-phenylacetyl-CoA epoxidase subunit PaaB